MCEEVYYKNWFTWQWRLRRPSHGVCELRTLGAGGFHGLSPRAQKPKPGATLAESRGRWKFQLQQESEFTPFYLCPCWVLRDEVMLGHLAEVALPNSGY